jgi:hypothetical protein
MSIYDKPSNPHDGSNYVDATTGETFVYLRGSWRGTFLSNIRPLKWIDNNSFICPEILMSELMDDKIFELGLKSIKRSRSLGRILYRIEDTGEIAVATMYFNDMFSN